MFYSCHVSNFSIFVLCFLSSLLYFAFRHFILLFLCVRWVVYLFVPTVSFLIPLFLCLLLLHSFSFYSLWLLLISVLRSLVLLFIFSFSFSCSCCHFTFIFRLKYIESIFFSSEVLRFNASSFPMGLMYLFF